VVGPTRRTWVPPETVVLGDGGSAPAGPSVRCRLARDDTGGALGQRARCFLEGDFSFHDGDGISAGGNIGGASRAGCVARHERSLSSRVARRWRRLFGARTRRRPTGPGASASEPRRSPHGGRCGSTPQSRSSFGLSRLVRVLLRTPAVGRSRSRAGARCEPRAGTVERACPRLERLVVMRGSGFARASGSSLRSRFVRSVFRCLRRRSSLRAIS
jgi:hypothetical protein